MCAGAGAHTTNYKSLILLILYRIFLLKRRFYAGLGDVGVLVIVTFCKAPSFVR